MANPKVAAMRAADAAVRSILRPRPGRPSMAGLGMAGAFLRQQQGGGLAQRLVDRSFTKDSTLLYPPLCRVGDTGRPQDQPAACPRALVAMIVGRVRGAARGRLPGDRSA